MLGNYCDLMRKFNSLLVHSTLDSKHGGIQGQRDFVGEDAFYDVALIFLTLPMFLSCGM